MTGRTHRAAPGAAGGRWTRTNHVGDQVTLLEGPAVVTGLVLGTLVAGTVPARTRWAVAGGVATIGAVGAYDDLNGDSGTKGLAGHLRGLRRGRVTSGAVKIGAISASGLAMAVVLRVDRGTPVLHCGTVLDGALIAGAANLVNLLDLRPGRALKASALMVLVPALSSHTRGLALSVIAASTAAAPSDLTGRSMLGDCGANALGAALGGVAVAGARPLMRAALTAGVVVLTLASERVSFSEVIESTPWLRRIDLTGRARRPEPTPA